MGRQIQSYILPEDQRALLDFAENHDSVVATLRDADSPKIQPLTGSQSSESKALVFWNRGLLTNLERKWIPDPGYYRVDTLHLPVLEFIPSLKTTWEGKAAVVQGRLFGDFDPYLAKPPEFEKWYESLARWIRKNYRKNSAKIGGYIGPAAYEIYPNGGYLIPNFVPPRTREWLDEISEQHSVKGREPQAKAAHSHVVGLFKGAACDFVCSL